MARDTFFASIILVMVVPLVPILAFPFTSRLLVGLMMFIPTFTASAPVPPSDIVLSTLAWAFLPIAMALFPLTLAPSPMATDEVRLPPLPDALVPIYTLLLPVVLLLPELFPRNTL